MDRRRTRAERLRDSRLLSERGKARQDSLAAQAHIDRSSMPEAMRVFEAIERTARARVPVYHQANPRNRTRPFAVPRTTDARQHQEPRAVRRARPVWERGWLTEAGRLKRRVRRARSVLRRAGVAADA